MQIGSLYLEKTCLNGKVCKEIVDNFHVGQQLQQPW